MSCFSSTPARPRRASPSPSAPPRKSPARSLEPRGRCPWRPLGRVTSSLASPPKASDAAFSRVSRSRRAESSVSLQAPVLACQSSHVPGTFMGTGRANTQIPEPPVLGTESLGASLRVGRLWGPSSVVTQRPCYFTLSSLQNGAVKNSQVSGL